MSADQQRPPVAPYVVYHAFRPQVAIYSSPDVDELAAANGLRNLAQLLKPWEASVERVTLRTSTFVSHVVPVFPLLIDDARDLVHTELDALFLDGLSESITKRVPQWLESMDSIDVHDDSDEDLWKEGTIDELTPWYGHYRRALINLRPRTEYETFGHPVACIIAVSTSNPEPLNAFAELYDATSLERLFADKPWVDPNVLRYYVLVHDATIGPAEDFAPLLEDIRRAYGLHTNMLILNSEAAPKPDSAYIDASQRPLPKPADFSRHWSDMVTSPTLQNFDVESTTPAVGINDASSNDAEKEIVEAGAKLGEEDVRRIKLFLREFVVQNLAPWLERTASQLNETLAASRKGIAGRLFSAGRRYFGSRPASPAVGANNASSFDPIKGFYRYSAQEAQTRRLADLALMIADYRLASVNYEIARKDFLNDKAWRYYSSATSMAGLLNLLLRKVPLSTTLAPESDPYLEQAASTPISGSVQLDALRAIALYYELYQEQEDWRAAALALGKAASDSDELPSALMIEQAAMAVLRLPHPARRRFALLMTIAALRYQKTGPKSLADRCGRQALSLFSNLNPRDWSTFRNHLERMLGRQAYNDGKAAVALSHFLNVIVEDASNEGPTKEEGQDFLDDLQLAWNSLGRTADDIARSTGLKLPEKIFDPKRTAIHSKILNPAAIRSDTEAWTSLEQLFLEHGFPYTPEGSRAVVKKPASLLDDITLNIATVEEDFLVEVWAQNALDVPVTINDVCLVFVGEGLVSEILPETTLAPKMATRVVINVNAKREGSYTLDAITFRYNQLLKCTESLTRKGSRLHATKEQLLHATYAEDSTLKVLVKPPRPLLQVRCANGIPTLLEGETANITFSLRNSGSRTLRHLRVLCDNSHMSFIQEPGHSQLPGGTVIDNVLSTPRPASVALVDSQLDPGDRVEWAITLRGASVGSHKLRWLFAFSSTDERDSQLHTACHAEEIVVIPSFKLQASNTLAHGAFIALQMQNASVLEPVQIVDALVLSPAWKVRSGLVNKTEALDVSQSTFMRLPLEETRNPTDAREVLHATVQQLDALLHGKDLASQLSSTINLACSSLREDGARYTIKHLYATRSALRRAMLHRQFPSLDPTALAKIFPLFNPFTIDLIVFWQLPQTNRTGWHYLPDLEATRGPNVVIDLLEKAAATFGGGRYEESAQERLKLIEQIHTSDLARSDCPVAVTCQDTNSKRSSASTVKCAFVIVNHGRNPATCTLELLPASLSPHSAHCTAVRWKGRLIHRVTIDPGKQATCLARYEKPKAVANCGSWHLSVNDGIDAWRVAGSEQVAV